MKNFSLADWNVLKALFDFTLLSPKTLDSGAVHMSRASPANRADLSHENLYFSTT